MIFIHPIQNGLQNIFWTHGTLTGDIIATCGSIRDRAIIMNPVIIPGSSFLKTVLQRKGMIIDHIHNDAKSLSVKRLHKFFKLFDPDFPMIWIGWIGTLRYVVIYRIISPVKLIARLPFIHRTEIVNRHQLNMCNAQSFQPSNPGGMFAVIM